MLTKVDRRHADNTRREELLEEAVEDAFPGKYMIYPNDDWAWFRIHTIAWNSTVICKVTRWPFRRLRLYLWEEKYLEGCTRLANNLEALGYKVTMITGFYPKESKTTNTEVDPMNISEESVDITEVGKHETSYLDRHGNKIVVNHYPWSAVATFTDGGKAVDDLLKRIPPDTSPQDVAFLIGRVMEVVDDFLCDLQSDMQIFTTPIECEDEEEDEYFVTRDGIRRIAEAYQAVDKMSLEEELAKCAQEEKEFAERAREGGQ